MKPFIKACEIWAPSHQGLELEFVSGHYGELNNFRSVSEGKTFGYDHGLPGKAWAQRHPIVLNDLKSSYFERGDAAEKAGITTAIAMPVFAGQCLQAVMVMLCGDDEEVSGAIELWHCDERESHDLAFVDGYFGKLERFEFVSRHTSFRRGTGLPGIVWETGMPKLFPKLGRSHKFIRSESAVESGITTGLGVPFHSLPHQIYVMTFLSALGTPIARQIELWAPSYDNSLLLFSEGYTVDQFDLNEQYAETKLTLGQGVIGRTFLTGMPQICIDMDEILCSETFPERGLDVSSLVTFPIFEDGYCRCVIALYT